MRKQQEKITKRNRHGEVLIPEVVTGGTYAALLDAIGELLSKARSSIARHINTTLVRTYWGTGRHIVEYEQNGEDRAKYGASLINNLVHDLRTRYGRGFSKTNLIYMRKFYLVFRKSQTVSDLLSWSHYMELLRITDKLEMQFYCAECIRSNWNVRELHRQIESALFQRIALSRDRKGVLELARKGNDVRRPEDIYRDSYVLEFSGIPARAKYKESRLHNSLVEHMKNFMLELGKGFAFVASQYRIPINSSKPCHVDLVFYNYFLKCFVLIDLKKSMVEHYDIGQMNLYLNYFRAEEGTPSDAAPIGIVLGAEKDDLIVEYATQGITNKLFVSRYQLYLPDKEQLRHELSCFIGNGGRCTKTDGRKLPK